MNGKYIKELDKKPSIDGSESVLIQDDEGAKQLTITTLINTVNNNIKNNNNNVAFDPSEFATAFVQALQSTQIKFTPDESSDNDAMPVKITTGFKIG